jgi:hypothetical protein
MCRLFGMTGGDQRVRATLWLLEAPDSLAHHSRRARVVQDLDKLEQELGPDRELVGGDTDSERLFALITRDIERAGDDVGAGIRAAARWVADQLPLYACACGRRLWPISRR